jgi:ribosomal subunit interface protein
MKLRDLHNGNRMNVVLRYRGLKPRAGLQALIEAQLRKLHMLAAIASARVTLEWQQQIKRAFRVLAVLEVPGPDFHAEASDYTIEAALRKVIKNLERQIRSRKNRRLERRKTKPQIGLLPGRLPSVLAGSRP